MIRLQRLAWWSLIVGGLAVVALFNIQTLAFCFSPMLLPPTGTGTGSSIGWRTWRTTAVQVRVLPSISRVHPGLGPTAATRTRTRTARYLAYIPPEECEDMKEKTYSTIKMGLSRDANVSSAPPKLTPTVGDLVRYFDLDGGQSDGEELVGRIVFLSRVQPKEAKAAETLMNTTLLSEEDPCRSSATCSFLAELEPLEDLGDGYFGEYSPTQWKKAWRLLRNKQTTRLVSEISPLKYVYVRPEHAYKVALSRENGTLLVRQENYDWHDWNGTIQKGGSHYSTNIDTKIWELDLQEYEQFKDEWFRQTELLGLAGTLVAGSFKGLQVAAVFAIGVLAGLLYLYLLVSKIDALGHMVELTRAAGVQEPNDSSSNNSTSLQLLSSEKKSTSKYHLRFFLPVLVLMGIAWYNHSVQLSNVVPPTPLTTIDSTDTVVTESTTSLWNSISQEQFIASMSGFLTYRLPLFWKQWEAVLMSANDTSLSVSPSNLPRFGSTQVAMQLFKAMTTAQADFLENEKDSSNQTIPAMVVTGPDIAGRTRLLQNVVNQRKDGRFRLLQWAPPKEPISVVSVDDLQFLDESTGKKLSLTNEDLLSSTTTATSNSKVAPVLVLDVPVDSVEGVYSKLQEDPRFGVVNVWVSLHDPNFLTRRIEEELDAGHIPIPLGQTRHAVLAQYQENVMRDIQFGMDSDIFHSVLIVDDGSDSCKAFESTADFFYPKPIAVDGMP